MLANGLATRVNRHEVVGAVEDVKLPLSQNQAISKIYGSFLGMNPIGYWPYILLPSRIPCHAKHWS
ncbi:MAG: hypothetical protein CMJ74_03640 [Planctomycetaceae bacterium]|nr:hypothetical protein [Planctomycetaceae bacterium]